MPVAVSEELEIDVLRCLCVQGLHKLDYEDANQLGDGGFPLVRRRGAHCLSRVGRHRREVHSQYQVMQVG